MLAVPMARLSSEVCTTSGRKPAAASCSPPRAASALPSSDSGASTQPVNRPLAFHSLSPCRSRIRVLITAILGDEPIRRVSSRLACATSAGSSASSLRCYHASAPEREPAFSRWPAWRRTQSSLQIRPASLFGGSNRVEDASGSETQDASDNKGPCPQRDRGDLRCRLHEPGGSA